MGSTPSPREAVFFDTDWTTRELRVAAYPESRFIIFDTSPNRGMHTEFHLALEDVDNLCSLLQSFKAAKEKE